MEIHAKGVSIKKPKTTRDRLKREKNPVVSSSAKPAISAKKARVPTRMLLNFRFNKGAISVLNQIRKRIMHKSRIAPLIPWDGKTPTMEKGTAKQSAI